MKEVTEKVRVMVFKSFQALQLDLDSDVIDETTEYIEMLAEEVLLLSLLNAIAHYPFT